jgi:glycerol-3-phosphate acyltransferase PlsY
MDFLSNSNFLMYIVAYLIGAIPFGLILAKRFANVDIKQSGSKSIGATNVLRVVKQKDPRLAKKLGIATLVLDALKGAVVLIVAKAFGFTQEALWGMAVLSVVGHCYSPYLNFEGGKGVATGVGVIAVMMPVEAIIGLITWGIVAKTLKISSISSLSGLLVGVGSSFILHPGLGINSQAPIILIAFIIFYKHIPNIIRLIKGEEKKV